MATPHINGLIFGSAEDGGGGFTRRGWTHVFCPEGLLPVIYFGRQGKRDTFSGDLSTVICVPFQALGSCFIQHFWQITEADVQCENVQIKKLATVTFSTSLYQNETLLVAKSFVYFPPLSFLLTHFICALPLISRMQNPNSEISHDFPHTTTSCHSCKNSKQTSAFQGPTKQILRSGINERHAPSILDQKAQYQK